MVDYRTIVDGLDVNPQSKEDWIEVLNRTHGDIEDGKAGLFLIADEEGFDVEAEDVEAVTDEPPTDTFL